MSFSGILFVLVLALVIFGPKKSIEIAKQVGRVIGELKRVSSRFQSQLEDELHNPKIAAPAPIEHPISTIEQTEINFG
jgi:sec-independent protein translocase protein TatB